MSDEEEVNSAEEKKDLFTELETVWQKPEDSELDEESVAGLQQTPEEESDLSSMAEYSSQMESVEDSHLEAIDVGYLTEADIELANSADMPPPSVHTEVEIQTARIVTDTASEEAPV